MVSVTVAAESVLVTVVAESVLVTVAADSVFVTAAADLVFLTVAADLVSVTVAADFVLVTVAADLVFLTTAADSVFVTTDTDIRLGNFEITGAARAADLALIPKSSIRRLDENLLNIFSDDKFLNDNPGGFKNGDGSYKIAVGSKILKERPGIGGLL